MKIKFIINFPSLKFWKKPEVAEKKLVSSGMSFWKKAADYADVFKLLLAVGLAYAVGSRFGSNQWEMMILGYFFFVLVRQVDSRLSAGLALALLILTPISLYWIDESFAETLAVYAFYFLCITVIQEMRELSSGTWAGVTEKIRAVKNKLNSFPAWRRAGALGTELKVDFFSSAQAIGRYWNIFWMLLAVYAAMLFFFKFETNQLVFYALMVFAAISALARIREWRKRKTTA